MRFVGQTDGCSLLSLRTMRTGESSQCTTPSGSCWRSIGSLYARSRTTDALLLVGVCTTVGTAYTLCDSGRKTWYDCLGMKHSNLFRVPTAHLLAGLVMLAGSALILCASIGFALMLWR